MGENTGDKNKSFTGENSLWEGLARDGGSDANQIEEDTGALGRRVARGCHSNLEVTGCSRESESGSSPAHSISSVGSSFMGELGGLTNP